MVFEKEMGINVNFKNFILDFFDFFFPNFCLLCNKKITRSTFSLCSDCLGKLELSNKKDISEFYNHNFVQSKLITNFYSKFEFVKDGFFQKIIHQLKYNGKSHIGILLGRELGKDLSKQSWFEEIDIMIPVPIHRIKKFIRGYNQSLLIVKGINQITKKSYDDNIIKRIKNTETQTHLHLHERIENVKDAFKVINKGKVLNKKILIVDDVCTTGSTVSEIARTLLDAGAKELNLATLAFVKEKDFDIKV